jgi:APA family basic amino acid/polyamine antiporter
VFAIWARYGSGREAVFWGFLVLVAGIPIYTWRTWRSKVEAEKADAFLPMVPGAKR